MNYGKLIKKLSIPKEFRAPRRLIYQDMVAQPLSRKDLDADVLAYNSGLSEFKKYRPSIQKKGPKSKEFLQLNLAWHERQFRDNMSYAYVIYDENEEYLGCFYIYPLGYLSLLNEELMELDAEISWWVTPDAFLRGYYEKVYEATLKWLEKFPLEKVYYSNKRLPEGAENKVKIKKSARYQ